MTTTSTLAMRKRYESVTDPLEAYAITHNGTLAGRIVISCKATRSGHMVRAFFHLFGSPMVEGTASGGGYDMRAAALSDALGKAWPSMEVQTRASFEHVAKRLESAHVYNALPLLSGGWQAFQAI